MSDTIFDNIKQRLVAFFKTFGSEDTWNKQQTEIWKRLLSELEEAAKAQEKKAPIAESELRKGGTVKRKPRTRNLRKGGALLFGMKHGIKK
jgi:hypothetical protein